MAKKAPTKEEQVVEVPEKSKGGRPLKNIDRDQVFELAKIHCTAEEIASVLKCAKATIYDRFSDVLREGHEAGQQSLKRKMHDVAMSGNVQMLIWLSKQRLGYKESQPIEATQIMFNVYIDEVPK